MPSYKAFLFLLALTTISLVSTHNPETYEGDLKCHHDQIEHAPQLLDVEEDFPPCDNGRLLGSSSYSQIKIYPYYDVLDSAPTTYKQYIEYDLAPPAIAYFQAALAVKYPVTGTLKVPSVQTTVCNTKTPEILFTGVNADYFVFYDSTYDSTSLWVAESTVCYMATGSNRPLVSTTKLNRALLKVPGTDVLLHERNTYLLLHEMTHTFGFSTSLYPYFLDANGNTRTGHISSATLDGATSIVINVPPLTQKLRSFFGCSSLAGAYMENSGGGGTDGSHFERRQFVYEYMTSGLIYQQRVSEFALALLEGSGWYVPNYDYAEPYYFGEGEGCSFLMSSCSSSSFNFPEFCKTSSRGCTSQGRGGGDCGSDTRSDGCSYYDADINYYCQNADAINYARLPDLQSYGRTAGSKCFTGDLTSKGHTASSTSFCFKPACQGSGANTVLKIQVGSSQVTCTEEGSVEVSGYSGTIDCPDPLTFCSTVGKAYCIRNCMGRGECVNNICECYSGFSGIDCGLRS